MTIYTYNNIPHPPACSVTITLGSLGLLAAAAVSAQAQNTTADSDPLLLPETVIVANRVATPLNQVGSAVSVIDADELEQRQIRVVSDALRDIPGVTVSRSGGPGSLTDVRIRGAENNHTLVLIDGVEANDPAISAFDFAHLLNVEVERIEVLRGPQSALWGSDAIGGVINIVTRRGSGPLRTTASIEGGSFGSSQITTGISAGNARYNYSFGASYLYTDGFSISPLGPEDDGYENLTLSAKTGYALSDQLDIEIVARYIDSTTESDPQDFGFPPTPTNGLVIDGDDESDNTQFFGRAKSTLSLLDGDWQHTIGVSLTDTDTDFFSDGALANALDGRKLKFDYQTSYYLNTDNSENIFTLALEREKEEYTQRGDTPDAPSNQDRSITTYSAVGEYSLALSEQWFVTAALRFDDNDDFDDATTYRLTGAYQLDSGTRFHSSYGTGVKNPTFTELFGFFPDSFIGNPDLQPEESRVWDIGVEQKLFSDASWVADVTYFRGRFEDEIINTFDNDTFLSSVENADGTSKRSGVELSLRGRLSDQLTLTASYSYVDSEDPDGEDELRRPRHSGSLNLNYSFAENRGQVNLGVSYTGDQDDLFFGTFPSTRVVLDNYTLVDVSGSYQLSDTISVYGRVENLLDEDYQDVFGYDTAGIGAFVGVKASF